MINQSKPRVRFAPSPTGYLHIGGARTALYNYLFAKQSGGTFILRIEDTDLERSTDESIQAILDGMNWLGLTWDEGPHFQTKRFDLYNQHIDQLIKDKKAYPCFCTAETLDEKRKMAMANKEKPKYDRTCLNLSEEAIQEKLKTKTPHVIRFLSSNEGTIKINDLIKGPVTVQASELDDLIIRRTDASPTYNLTVVIDDASMNITHVIRGDDHLNNTPRQIQLYEALGYAIPQFAHVPMILGADKKRLSKRHGATSVMAYDEMGYLPQALLNYLVRLGWSHGDQEIFSMDEMIQLFKLENVSASAGVFNPEKLDWLNGHYIRESKVQDLLPRVKQLMIQKGIDNIDDEKLTKAIKATQEKMKSLNDFPEMIDCLFVDITPDDQLKEKSINASTLPILQTCLDEFSTLDEWNHENIAATLTKLMEKLGLKLGKIAQPLRLALSGKKVSPGIYDLIEILGKEVTLRRISKYL